jgi:hypothetical protein
LQPFQPHEAGTLGCTVADTRPLAQAAMRSTNAVVGILGAALYDPVRTSAVLGPRDFAVALVGFVLLTVWKTPRLSSRQHHGNTSRTTTRTGRPADVIGSRRRSSRSLGRPSAEMSGLANQQHS